MLFCSFYGAFTRTVQVKIPAKSPVSYKFSLHIYRDDVIARNGCFVGLVCDKSSITWCLDPSRHFETLKNFSSFYGFIFIRTFIGRPVKCLLCQ